MPPDECWNNGCSAHFSITSTACSSRSITLPGVAPASLISIRTAPSYFAKNRSITAFQLAPNPLTLVRIETWAPPVSEGCIKTSMSPDPTTPTCAFPVTRRTADGYSNLSCSISRLPFAPVFTYFALPALHRIQKNRCRQQVSTSAGRKMPADQFTIEFTHLLPAVCTAVSALQ